jgi:hypothetical protein
MPILRRTAPARPTVLAGAFALTVATVVMILTLTSKVAPRHSTPLSSQSQSAQPVAASEISPAARAQVAETYGKLPLTFETNQGQSDKQVKFLSRGEGYTLFLTGDEAVMSLRRAPVRALDRDALVALKPADFKATNQNAAVLRMKLLGVNPAAKISGSDLQEGKSNYFIGNDPSQWRTDVSNFSQVRYRDAYPGIDLVYYGNRHELEYDFVVAPGADPRAIALDVAAESTLSGKRTSAPLRVAANGDLLVPTESGDVTFHKPVVYQPAVAQSTDAADVHAIGGNPAAPTANDSVDGRWVLKGGNRVGFEVASYDATRALIIDPVLSYSTYVGGTGTDGAFGVAIDQYGNAYVTGFTSSTNFPTKSPYQKANAGGIDTFAFKLNRTGTALVYSTYLGGSGTEYPFGMAVDSKGEAYEIGNTGSNNFPVTTGAFQTACPSCTNYPAVFLTKFSMAGNSLLYSTYLGGSGDNRAFGITLDSLGDAYLVGWTTSTNFPTTPGAYQTSNNASVNTAFVSEINPAGKGTLDLVYSTYLGGTNDDVGFGIALDSSNNIIATGYTYSLDFPTTSGAFQTSTTVNGAAWITKLNPAATGLAQLVYSTFLGGTDGTSAGNSVVVDSSGNAYVTGYTCATDFPVTAGVVQPTFGGDCTPAGGDAFVTEMNSTGSAPVFSTYLGGTGDDVGFSIGRDQNGNIYITGRSSSTNYPVSPGAFQPANAGGYDATYSVLSPGGTQLVYSTYLGGTAVDVAFVMAVDKLGNSYMIGRTYSTNFPVTPGVVQSTLKGATNALVFKFAPGDQAWPMALNFGSDSVGTTSSPLSTTFTNSDTVTLNISPATIVGTGAADYKISSNTCGTTLAPGASCTISVTFTPSTTGTLSAVLAINDSAANTPQNVALAGVGSTSNATLTPASLTYATQLINTSSASQAATLTNTGSTTITISNIATTGPYNQTNNCGATLASLASCTINVVFTPTKSGTQTGTLTVTDNAPNSPQTTALTGVGTVVSFSPTSLNFGTQKVKTSSPPQTITMTNNGSSSINITKTYVTGSRVTSFIIQSGSTCPLASGSLGAGASCTIVVVFDPQLKGALNANATVIDTGGGTSQSVPMSGTGD